MNGDRYEMVLDQKSIHERENLLKQICVTHFNEKLAAIDGKKGFQ